jgi:hypothetical protein
LRAYVTGEYDPVWHGCGVKYTNALSGQGTRETRSRTGLLKAIEQQTLGQGSVAEGEYLRNMQEARLCADQTARWVEVCYCPTPLQEERPYWEEYFDLTKVQDAHDRRRCRDQNGTEPWACGDCDCTEKLERRLQQLGPPLLSSLRKPPEPEPQED